jgi:hypothetical protein
LIFFAYNFEQEKMIFFSYILGRGEYLLTVWKKLGCNQTMASSTHGQAGAVAVAQALVIFFCIFRSLFRVKLKFLGVNLG